MIEFFELSKYLSDPLILVGFILFIVFGVLKILLSSGGYAPKLSKKTVSSLSNKILLYGFIVSALVVILGFGLNFTKLLVNKAEPTNPLIPRGQLLPFSAGWILVGFFNENTQDYLEGGYAEIVYRPDTSQPARKTPIIGDILRVKKDRNVVIANFQKQGLTYQFTSILDDSVLEPGEKVKI